MYDNKSGYMTTNLKIPLLKSLSFYVQHTHASLKLGILLLSKIKKNTIQKTPPSQPVTLTVVKFERNLIYHQLASYF